MALYLMLRGVTPYELIPGVDVTIGRGQHCDVSVYSSLLSREHARVRWEGGQPVLFDLESLNGCYIGPDRITRHRIRHGDVVRLGDVTIELLESDGPPPVLGDDPPTPFPPDDLAPPIEPGCETRLFSRTAALHQRVFEYDEMGWLDDRLAPEATAVLVPDVQPAQIASWASGLADPGPFWRLLQLGVLAPTDAEPLRGLSAAEAAGRCRLTVRGERYAERQAGKRIHWNEMASLRYRLRNGRLFHALRFVGRAYRPGGGLTEVDIRRFVYEVTHIYAAELAPEVMEAELGLLLRMGFLRPADGAQDEAWYPGAWDDGSVQVAERGYAILEGFRVEE